MKYAGISQSNSSEFYLQKFYSTVLVKNYSIIFKIASKITTKLILLYKCYYTCAPLSCQIVTGIHGQGHDRDGNSEIALATSSLHRLLVLVAKS